MVEVVIVTGASGFIGGHVLAELRRRGVEAVGLYRQRPSRPQLGRVVTSWEKSALIEAIRGARCIVHAASIVHSPSTSDVDYQRFNVDGTQLLVAAAREVGVERFVFISSIKVYGEAPGVAIIDETTPVAAEAAYARTKAEAEQIVLSALDMCPVVLRLCPVYGRGDKGNVRFVIRSVQGRRFFVPGRGDARKSIVHISTVSGLVAEAAHQRTAGLFVVADEYAPTIRELADTIASLLGRRRPIAVPERWLFWAADVAGVVASRLGVGSRVSRALVEKAMTSTVCSPRKVREAFGVSCRVDLRLAIAEEIDWLRTSRLL